MNLTTLGQLGLSAAAAAILLAQLTILRRQHKLMELAALQEVRAMWRDLRPAWTVTLAMGGSMYAEIREEILESYPEADVLRTWHDNIGQYVYKRKEELPPLPEGLHAAVRDCLETLALICAMLLRGRMTPAAAYEALGPSITRNGEPIRTLLNEPKRSGWFISWYPGIARRINILVDLLWVEAVRAADLQEHEADRALNTKRQRNTQRHNRARMRQDAVRLGGWRRALALEWHLTYAEVNPSQPIWRRVPERVWRFAAGFGRMETRPKG